MIDAFTVQDTLFDLFSTDDLLCSLLDVDGSDNELLNQKFRREDMLPEVFHEKFLDFIVFYFADAEPSKNFLVNRGMLRLDIYAKYRDSAREVRKRCLELVQKQFDIRLIAEGQRESGVSNVFKYRLEFLPLVSS